ncbi:MAG: hypothetical protein QXO67_04830, partial [Candidatus Bathyarchaeia archaeon]
VRRGGDRVDKGCTIGFLLLALGAMLIIHHVVLWQRLFDLTDILHHEFFEAILFTAGFTLLVSKHFSKNRKRA